MKKRTTVDFSKHEHKIEIFKSEDGGEIRVDHLRIPGSSNYYIKFINTSTGMTVNGDLGNWVFCRPFVPSASEEQISDGYWCEKLRNASTQSAGTYDAEIVREDIKEILKELKEENEDGDDDDDYKKEREYWEELSAEADDEMEYLYKAHRGWNKPEWIDHEQVPNGKDMNVWLKIIFDGFEEICSRIKNNS